VRAASFHNSTRGAPEVSPARRSGLGTDAKKSPSAVGAAPGQRKTVLGAEHDVDHILRAGVGDVSHLRCFWVIVDG
jgi:hypothetical protein